MEQMESNRAFDSTQQNSNPLLNSQLLEELSSIPDKLGFKIGEVAEMADVKPYVLRYWENEFEILRPKKSDHNQRVFSKKDVETVLLIRKLLYRDRFSIEGARMALKGLKSEVKKAQKEKIYDKQIEKAIGLVHELKNDLSKLKDLLC